MARSRKYTSARRNRYLTENRGQGEGVTYKPWHQVVGTASKGRVSRVKGVKIPRIYHFFNDLQRKFFYYFEWNLNVIDIREHYPLQRNATLEIAKSYGWRHPIDNQTKVHHDLTVEFFLTIKSDVGVNKFLAVTVVNNIKRLPHHKLRIIQKYFEKRHVEWKILTSKDLHLTVVKNFEWCRISYPESYEKGLLNEYLICLSRLQNEQSNCLNIVEAAIRVSDAMEISIESSISVLKHLLAHKILKPISDRTLFSEAQLNDFNIPIPLNQIQGRLNAG